MACQSGQLLGPVWPLSLAFCWSHHAPWGGPVSLLRRVCVCLLRSTCCWSQSTQLSVLSPQISVQIRARGGLALSVVYKTSSALSALPPPSRAPGLALDPGEAWACVPCAHRQP